MKSLYFPRIRENFWKSKGHTLKERSNMGALMGITFDPETSVYFGASDTSQPDSGAVGY